MAEPKAKKKKDQIEITNSENIIQNVDYNKIDYIFSRSTTLDAEGIIHFIKNLCNLARDELFNQHNPRIFSLQKIVEVADCNMGRIRYVW
jgi:brefeldin A-inhibited guanine nucleotide-exchange protein